MPTGGYQVRQPPAHAGRLRLWERVTITVVFVLVAAAIATVMVLTAGSHTTASTAPRAHGHRTERTRSHR